MFKGLYTALITPFKNNLSIDYNCLEKLILEQIEAKVDGIVINGTTAESPNLNDEERVNIINLAIKNKVKGVKILVGTGSNSTEKTIKLSKEAENLGADGILVVNPYYNKPNQNGLFEHFSQVANSVKIPLILYNIEGRTGVNIKVETFEKLSKIKNIVSIKEASGNIDQMMNFISVKPKDFTVLSGDDALTLPLISLGGDGLISVVSNIIPKEMKKMIDFCLSGNFEEAKKIHYQFLPLMKACFLDTNPIPVKTILSIKGKIDENFRSPLCKTNEEIRRMLFNIVQTL